jgi:hypothetical protein
MAPEDDKRDSGVKEYPEEDEVKEAQEEFEETMSEEEKELMKSSGKAAKDNRKKEK